MCARPRGQGWLPGLLAAGDPQDRSRRGACRAAPPRSARSRGRRAVFALGEVADGSAYFIAPAGTTEYSARPDLGGPHLRHRSVAHRARLAGARHVTAAGGVRRDRAGTRRTDGRRTAERLAPTYQDAGQSLDRIKGTLFEVHTLAAGDLTGTPQPA
jgi:hypothetical protein